MVISLSAAKLSLDSKSSQSFLKMFYLRTVTSSFLGYKPIFYTCLIFSNKENHIAFSQQKIKNKKIFPFKQSLERNLRVKYDFWILAGMLHIDRDSYVFLWQ